MKFDGSAPPECTHDVDHFIEAPTSALEIHPENLEFLFHPAGTGAEQNPVVAIESEGGQGFGDLQGMVEGEDVDQRAEANIAGSGGHRGDGDPGIREGGIDVEGGMPVFTIEVGGLKIFRNHQVFGNQDSLEADRFGFARDLG